MSRIHRLLRKPFFIRLTKWEYWGFHTIYAPLYPVWLWFCLRARSLFFFAASNPGIPYGGFLGESKKDIAALIPGELHPRTVFFAIPANPDLVLLELERKGLQFPLIGKPDIGARGRGVTALQDADALKDFVRTSYTHFHIQEFVAYPNEVGIFYFRLPGAQAGRITGIVRKEFLTVRGDGKSTIRQLLQKDPRHILQLKALETSMGALMPAIPAAHEEMVLVPYGNHARGAKFLDDSSRIDDALESAMDNICQRIPGFYFGRLDIRYRDWESLREGRDLTIIEVNGAGSEPTHIYDPAHSLFFAWKEIVRHWQILYRVSVLNHRRGHRYLTWKEGREMFRIDRLNSRKLSAMERNSQVNAGRGQEPDSGPGAS